MKPSSVSQESVCLVNLFTTCTKLLGKENPDNAAEDSASILSNLLGTSKALPREAVIHHGLSCEIQLRRRYG